MEMIRDEATAFAEEKKLVKFMEKNPEVVQVLSDAGFLTEEVDDYREMISVFLDLLKRVKK